MPRPQQQSPRRRKRVEVRYGKGEPQFVGFSGNVSQSGIMVRTTRVFPPGTVLKLELKFPDSSYRMNGVVMWARSGGVQWLATGRIGMGIMFVNPPEDFVKAVGDPRPA